MLNPVLSIEPITSTFVRIVRSVLVFGEFAIRRAPLGRKFRFPDSVPVDAFSCEMSKQLLRFLIATSGFGLMSPADETDGGRDDDDDCDVEIQSASIAFDALRLKCSRKLSICASMELGVVLAILTALDPKINSFTQTQLRLALQRPPRPCLRLAEPHSANFYLFITNFFLSFHLRLPPDGSLFARSPRFDFFTLCVRVHATHSATVFGLKPKFFYASLSVLDSLETLARRKRFHSTRASSRYS